MAPAMRAVTVWPAPLVQPSTRIRLGSGNGSLARFRSSASWSRAPGPCEAPVPVTILTLPCQDGFCSREGPLSARSTEGTARFCASLTATAGTGTGT